MQTDYLLETKKLAKIFKKEYAVDEPTNGLDPIGIKDLRRLIKSFPEEGMTVIISSHILAEVEQVIDYVGIMSHGILGYQSKINPGEDLEALFMDVAENLKTKRTMLRKMLIFMPILCVVLASIGNRDIYFELDNHMPKGVIWYIDYASMKRAFMNIIINALEHTPDKASLNLDVSLKNNLASFVITDSGKGFCSESLKKATELFYTDNKSRSQTGHYGIGLSFADKIIKAHNGTLRIQNNQIQAVDRL